MGACFIKQQASKCLAKVMTKEKIKSSENNQVESYLCLSGCRIP